MKGGVGKTTLAVNISHVLNQEFGHRVLTIDIDPQFNATQIVYKQTDWVYILREEVHTALRIFLDEEFESIRIDGQWVQPIRFEDIEPKAVEKNWHFLPGTINLYKIELNYFKILKFKLKEYIDYLRKTKRYDFVIIDTPPTPSSWMRSAIIASDYYLMPVKPDAVSTMGISLLMRIIRELKEQENESNIELLGIVFNMCENLKDHQQQIEYLANHNLFSQYIFEHQLKKRADISAISHKETLLTDRLIYTKSSKAAKEEIVAITKELKQKLRHVR